MDTELETRAYEDALERRLDDWGLKLDRFEIDQTMMTPGGARERAEHGTETARPDVRQLLETARSTLRELRATGEAEERRRLRQELEELSRTIHRRIDEARH